MLIQRAHDVTVKIYKKTFIGISPGADVPNPAPVVTKCLFYDMGKNQLLIVEVIKKTWNQFFQA